MKNTIKIVREPVGYKKGISVTYNTVYSVQLLYYQQNLNRINTFNTIPSIGYTISGLHQLKVMP